MTFTQIDPSPMLHHTGWTPPSMSFRAIATYVEAALAFLVVLWLAALASQYFDDWWRRGR